MLGLLQKTILIIEHRYKSFIQRCGLKTRGKIKKVRMTMADQKIYLASKSPRRRELLRQIGVDFELLMPYATVMTSTQRLWLSRLIEWQKLDVTLAKFARDHNYSYLLINRWKRWSTQKVQALGLFSVIEKPEFMDTGKICLKAL